MDMNDLFPGFLGYGGIIAIHADWPMYPKGIGWEVALKALGCFPSQTEFYQIDDIDQCKLLVNKNPDGLKDAFDYKNYHVATWHGDLIELHERKFIKGIGPQSEYEFKLAFFESLKKDLHAEEDENGDLILYYRINNELQKPFTKDQRLMY